MKLAENVNNVLLFHDEAVATPMHMRSSVSSSFQENSLRYSAVTVTLVLRDSQGHCTERFLESN
jgi:hypothetical protein